MILVAAFERFGWIAEASLFRHFLLLKRGKAMLHRGRTHKYCPSFGRKTPSVDGGRSVRGSSQYQNIRVREVDEFFYFRYKRDPNSTRTQKQNLFIVIIYPAVIYRICLFCVTVLMKFILYHDSSWWQLRVRARQINRRYVFRFSDYHYVRSISRRRSSQESESSCFALAQREEDAKLFV